MPEIVNHTGYLLEEIEAGEPIVTVKNNWRQRTIVLYAHPESPADVISVGRAFDGSVVVVCCEDRDDWRRELESGKQFVETD